MAGKKVDLTGRKFNYLTVVRFDHISSHGSKAYLCLCDCGKEKVYLSHQINTGSVISCGCQRGKKSKPTLREKNREEAKSRIGEKHGRLLIQDIIYGNKPQGWHYLCLCDCGNKTSVKKYSYLKNGTTTSCGCYHKEQIAKIGVKTSIARYNVVYQKNNKYIPMRSIMELMFADILDSKEIEWEYEPRFFSLGKDLRYVPDFFVKDTNEWYEVKGNITTEAQIKINEFSKTHKLTVITQKEIEAEHPIKYRKYLKEYRKLHPVEA